MGDYYAKWTAYLDTNPTMPAGGILQLFKNWAQLHLSPGLAQKCYTEYQQVANEPALSLGYHHDDNLVWQHGAPSWADTFGPKGNLNHSGKSWRSPLDGTCYDL
jgi:hypothetical protein